MWAHQRDAAAELFAPGTPQRCEEIRGIRRLTERRPVSDLDLVALLTFAKQRGDRHFEMLAEEVEERGLQRGNRVDRYAQIEGLQAATSGIARTWASRWRASRRVPGLSPGS